LVVVVEEVVPLLVYLVVVVAQEPGVEVLAVLHNH
jgi:hypothetical protein